MTDLMSDNGVELTVVQIKYALRNTDMVVNVMSVGVPSLFSFVIFISQFAVTNIYFHIFNNRRGFESPLSLF